MKRIILFSLLVILFYPTESFANKYRMNNEFFYASLAPHGEWIEIDYDLVVWRPYGVQRDWRPYRVGRWLWTSEGWYWDSYEDFGWATYHYGRWFYDDFYGWVWLPGDEWAPAWVEWRYSDDYIGWAPLSPYASFRVGVGIHFSVHRPLHHHHWHFVKLRHFHGVEVHHYIVHNRNNHRILSNTRYRTNYYKKNGRIFNGGIERRYIERRLGKRIREKELVTTRSRSEGTAQNRSIRSSSIEVYRPGAKEITRTRTTTEVNIKRGERKSSLERSKIAVSRTRSKESPKVNRSRNENNQKKESRSKGSTKEKVKQRSSKTETGRSIKKDNSLKKQSRSVNRSEKESKTTARTSRRR